VKTIYLLSFFIISVNGIAATKTHERVVLAVHGGTGVAKKDLPAARRRRGSGRCNGAHDFGANSGERYGIEGAGKIVHRVTADHPVQALHVLADGTVVGIVRPTERGSRSAVRRWRLSDGEAVWSVAAEHPVFRSAVSADGKWLATGTYTGLVVLWDLATGKPRPRTDGHSGMIESIAFAPDGKTIRTTDATEMRTWDASTGKPGGRFKHPELVGYAHWDAAGKVIAAGANLISDDRRTVAVFDAATCRKLLTVSDPQRKKGFGFCGFGLSSDGTRLAVPVNRVALDASVINQFRPFKVYPDVRDWSFEGVSNYNSLQVTLSRQTGRRLQYFAAYTLARVEGTTTGNGEYGDIDPFDPSRTYGVLPEDRTHVFNLSWNAFLPDGAKGGMNNPVGRGLLNGWQLSGISTLASGVPIYLGFGGQAGSTGITQAIFGTPNIIGNPGPGGGNRGGLAPILTCDPRTGNTKVGTKILNIDCIKIPAFGENGDLIPKYNLRMPTRINHDLTVFKNFGITSEQKLQVRVGFFNLFNQAWATTQSAADVDMVLDTVCNVSVSGLPNGAGGTADNVCDPTRGFVYTELAKQNFGKINLKRGHRVIEFALKYYF
jgi:hypothetical protein